MRKILIKLSAVLLALTFVFSYKATVMADGIVALSKAAPAAVTNLKVDSIDYCLHWNAIPGTLRYEISATDGTYEYFGSYDKGNKWMSVTVNDQYGDVCTDYSVLAILSSLSRFDSAGKAIGGPVAGKDYTIRVRAVNASVNGNGEVYGEEYGPSASITYKMPSINLDAVKNITDFDYLYYDKLTNRYYFAIPSLKVNTRMRVQYSMNTNFSGTRMAELYQSNSEGLFYIKGEDIEMFAGKYLLFRAFCPAYRTSSNWYAFSNIEGLNVEAGQTTNIGEVKTLAINETQKENALTFTCTGALVDGAKVVVRYSTKSNFSSYKEIQVPDSSYAFPLSNLTEDTVYYFKALGSKKVVQYLWSSENETKDAFRTRAVAASGNSNITIYTPFSGQKIYYCKFDKDVYGTASNVVTYNKSSVCTEIKSFALEYVGGQYKVAFNNTALKANEKIQVSWSSDKSFPSGKDKYGDLITNAKTFSHEDSISGEVYLDLPPVVTYVRARIVKDEKGYIKGKNTQESYFFSKWSSTAKVSGSISPATITFHDKTPTSVVVYVGTKGGVSSGVEVQMKKSGKFSQIYKGSDPYYKVTGLKANTVYNFRARRYYYNYADRKYVYSDWVEDSIVTWGSEINVSAEVTGNNKIAVTWNSVSGAAGYEVYRAKVEYSNSAVNKKYNHYQLLKTVESSKKTFSDTSVTPNSSYTYLIKAFKIIGGKKYYVSGEDTTYYGFDTLLVTSEALGDGTVEVTWKRAKGAEYYYIEKFDQKTNSWKKFTKKNKYTRSYVLPRATSTDKNALYDRYRIRAGKSGNMYTSYSNTIYVYPLLKAPTNVKAKVASDGSVKITWDAVSGADYYVVYNTKSSYQTYDANKKGYKYVASKPIEAFKKNSKSFTGYTLVSKGALTTTTAYDVKIIEKDAFGISQEISSGPSAGTSYYYVVAYRNVPSSSAYANDSVVYSSSGSKSAKITVNSTVYSPKITVTASSGKVVISWGKYTKMDCVEVYKSTKSDSGFKKISTAYSTATLSHTDTDVKKGTKYYYKIRVKVRDKDGDIAPTDYSPVKSVTAK